MAKTIQPEEAWNGIADCRICTLRESVLFAGLDEKDFDKVHHPIEQLNLEAGTTLYRAGEHGSALYTIRQGLVKLVQYLPDGSQRIVRLCQNTNLIGLEALLGQPYQHDAILLVNSDFCTLPVNVVKRLSSENPSLHTELLNRWQHALSEADAWLTELSTGSARQRVARLLLRLTKSNPDKECLLFSREDIGSILGVTTETASRTIAEFRRQGLLKESSGKHYACNLAGLQKIAEE